MNDSRTILHTTAAFGSQPASGLIAGGRPWGTGAGPERPKADSVRIVPFYWVGAAALSIVIWAFAAQLI